MTNDNPWKLTKREAEILDLWAIHGTQTAAGKALGLSRHTATTYVTRAALKMEAKHPTHALLMWDRFAFGGFSPVDNSEGPA